MKIINKIRSSIWVSTLVIGSFLLPGSAIAGEGSLLGLNIAGYPNFDYSQVPGAAGQECTYNAGTDTLSIKAEATFVFFSDSSIGFLTAGLLEVTATISDSGVLSGGTFTLSGSVSDGSTSYSGVLLSGDVLDYGIKNLTPGNTDQADFRLDPTGGDMIGLMGANDIALLTTLETTANNPSGSTGYAGTMTADWACDRAKGQGGPTPPLVAQGCGLSVVKTATTLNGDGTIGPVAPVWDGDPDTDSDSGRDHDSNGDTDDTDSDSEADSADSGANGSPNCGCKGRVEQLALRWNSLDVASVKITNKKETQTYFEGSVIPNQEIDFTLDAKEIRVFVDGGEIAKLKTKCKNPIGIGQQIGDFVVIGGYSKWGPSTQLCTYPGASCGPELEVTYDYTVSNTGETAYDVLVYDDQLGIIGSSIILANGESEMISVTTCVFDTTTNVATAMGNTATGGAGEVCDFDAGTPPTNTATVHLLPQPCGPDDSDSDSHSDHDNSGDTDDDSDSDSGPGDCDGDGT